MGEFFKGWRRKIGCVLLMTTLLVASGWVRSIRIEDAVRLTVFGRKHLIISSCSGLSWWAWDYSNQDAQSSIWTSGPIKPVPLRPGVFVHQDLDNIHNLPYDDLVHVILFENSSRHVGYWKISYSPIVLPMTLLSAYLLLGKPRVAKPKKMSEPVPAEAP